MKQHRTSVWQTLGVIAASVVALIALYHFLCEQFCTTGSISHPSEASYVSSEFYVSGITENLGLSEHPWLLIRVGELYWPKVPLPKERLWRVELTETKPAIRFDLILVVVDDNVHNRWLKWVEQGKEHGYPGISKPKGVNILDQVTITRFDTDAFSVNEAMLASELLPRCVFCFITSC